MKLLYSLLAGLYLAQLHAADDSAKQITKIDLNKVSIDLLKHHPEHINALVHLWYNVIGHERFSNFEAVKEKYTNIIQSTMQDAKLPIALIALLDGKPIGYCSMKDECIRNGTVPWADKNPDKKPWMALFIAKDYQKQGVGTKLVRTSLQYVRNQLHYSKAYALVVDPAIEALYTKKGCVKIADATLEDASPKPASVMEIDIDKTLPKDY